MNDKTLLILLKSIEKYPDKHIFDIYELLKDKVVKDEFISCFDKSDTVGYISKTDGVNGDITPLGKNKLKELEKELEEKNELKNLTKRNVELQLENAEYKITIRDQETKIRGLDIRIKTFDLIKSHWWLLTICITIGIAIKWLLDIIMSLI